jgi:plasmid stabilization system protein ParE
MAELIWTTPALDDLEQIAEYIARDNEAAARKLVQRVFNHVEQLAAHPESGGRIPEFKMHLIGKSSSRPVECFTAAMAGVFSFFMSCAANGFSAGLASCSGTSKAGPNENDPAPLTRVCPARWPGAFSGDESWRSFCSDGDRRSRCGLGLAGGCHARGESRGAVVVWRE